MQLNVVHYIVLAFIVVIGIIYMSNSMASAMVMAGCLAYILIITNNMATMQNHVNLSVASKEPIDLLEGADTAAPNILKNDPDESTHESKNAKHDFSAAYKDYDSFRQSYISDYDAPPARSAFSNTEKQYSVDLANTLNATRRFREKRAMEGAVLRNMDFYKYHFGDELDVYEAKPWWGRGEY